MTYSQESIRRALLIQLEAAYPLTLPIEILWQGLQLAHLTISSERVRKELAYLTEKGFVQRRTNELCPQHIRYKLASKGIDFLESEAL